MNRVINQVNFCVTTKCNLSCFDCCCGIPWVEKKWDADLDYVEYAAKRMRGKIDWIQITGGEPLMNPMIDSIVPKMRDLFSVKMLTMETNGFLVEQHIETMGHLNEFYVTQYDSLTFKNSVNRGVNNTECISRLLGMFGDKCRIVHPIHIPRNSRPGKGWCSRGTSGVVSYWMGEIYPCCVGPGIPECPTIKLSEDWNAKILDINPPCEKCWFAIGE